MRSPDPVAPSVVLDRQPPGASFRLELQNLLALPAFVLGEYGVAALLKELKTYAR